MIFILDIEPYRQQCIVVCNGQFDDAYQYIKKHKNKNAKQITAYIEEQIKKDKTFFDEPIEINNGQARLYTGLPKSYIMLISHQDNWRQTVSSVVHEAQHLAVYVLRKAGLKLCEESEEAYTYLQQEIVEKILYEIY